MKRTFLFAALAILFSTGCGKNEPEGGATLVIRVLPAEDSVTGAKLPLTRQSLEQTAEVLRKRADGMGSGRPVVTVTEPERITVQIPGLTADKLEDVRRKLQQPGKADFRMVHPENDSLLPAVTAKRQILDPAWKIFRMKTAKDGEAGDHELIVRRVPDITGEHIASADAGRDRRGSFIAIQFDQVGSEKFYDLTRKMRPSVDRFAIVVDGQILYAPSLGNQGGIFGGACRIDSDLTEDEARDIVVSLMNPLQNPVVIEEATVK